jgi:kynureninase
VLRPARRAAADRVRGGELPVGALPPAGAGGAGAEIVVCRDEEEIVAAIDERTLLVPISHVIFKTGRIQDVEPIVERAHEVGAHVVLDAYQSVGSVPLDVTALDVDFAVGGSVKWLCGGPGAGWLYVRPTWPRRSSRRSSAGRRTRGRSLRARARVRGWRVALPDRHAERAALYAATAGYDIVEEIGVDRIRANSVRQTELLAGLARRGRVRGRQPARAGAPRRVDRRSARPTSRAVHAQLEAREILCDFRPDVGLRIGPHFFNTDEEIELAVSAIREIVGRGARTPAPAAST